MTQPSGMYGAVDLSRLSTTPAQAPSDNSLIIDATDANFSSVLELSDTVPVIVDLWAEWCQPCKQLSPVLEKITLDYAGRIVLAKVDVDANPALAQAFQAQSIPMVLAIIKRQPVPLFQGAVPEADVRTVLEQVLTIAKENGVTGTLTPTTEEPVPPQLPPLHQEAVDAIDRSDYDAALKAYNAALRESPADEDARVGIEQVEFLKRTHDVDIASTLARAQEAPTDIDAQLAAADCEVLSGSTAQAFTRLLTCLRSTYGDDRESIRKRLVSLFDIVGSDHEDVVAARRELTSLLF